LIYAAKGCRPSHIEFGLNVIKSYGLKSAKKPILSQKGDVIFFDAESRFLAALSGVADPEKKRKIIGNLFIEIFEEEAGKLQDFDFLAQETIYSDVIESAGAASGKAHVIKSHHNVDGLPDHMRLKLAEPLRELFKDEVRRVGDELGLPKKMVYRHPFPGPGLGVRILGEVKKEYADILRQADVIYIDELHKAELYDSVSQAFAVFLPVKTVGVVGDARRYANTFPLKSLHYSKRRKNVLFIPLKIL
jgi:GMP synthase (glutamine-hydrolysing)